MKYNITNDKIKVSSIMKKLRSLLILFLLLSLPLSAQSLSVNSLLATVNGDPVTLMDVILEAGTAERELAAVYTGERLNREIEAHRKKTLEKIIDRKLVYKEYLREPFEIPRQLVESAIDRIASSFGNREHLEEKLKADGMTMGALRRQIRERIATDIILARNCDMHAFVTPKEVYEIYLAEGSKTPERISFLMIQLDRTETRNADALAEKLKADILTADETLFRRLAAEYSSNRNHTVSDMELNRLRPAFRNALKELKESETAGPLSTPEAVFFLRLKSRIPEARIPFEQVSGEIQETLMKKRIEERRQEYRKQLRAKAILEYYI